MPRQELPEIDERSCTLCGDCLPVCPTECLQFVETFSIAVDARRCISCGVCAAVCAPRAIAMSSPDW